MTADSSTILIGFSARLFDGEKTAREEIHFARDNAFHAIQFRGPENGIDEQYLGNSLEEVSALFDATRIVPTLELLVGLDDKGRTQSGKTPLEILRANIPAIAQLHIQHVHWHLYPYDYAEMDESEATPLEDAVIPEIKAGLSLAKERGFVFGIENNSPEGLMFVKPARCKNLLEQVPELGLVWDLNHTQSEDLCSFQALADRMSALHVSDTRLPETNEHLPIGLGSIDFSDYVKNLKDRTFAGPVILEIGGLPKSGGYGRDTNEALCHSRRQFEAALTNQNI